MQLAFNKPQRPCCGYSWLHRLSIPVPDGAGVPVLPIVGVVFGLLQALGAKDLAQGLVNNVSLHNLNLAWNGLEDAGCTAIAHTLHQNMGLKVCLR